jgi:hypothetical protein
MPTTMTMSRFEGVGVEIKKGEVVAFRGGK